jgi:hypothetical protein
VVKIKVIAGCKMREVRCKNLHDDEF